MLDKVEQPSGLQAFGMYINGESLAAPSGSMHIGWFRSPSRSAASGKAALAVRTGWTASAITPKQSRSMSSFQASRAIPSVWDNGGPAAVD
jgi:hypothetical protein